MKKSVTVSQDAGDDDFIAGPRGIDQVIAEVLPGDKASKVVRLQKAGLPEPYRSEPAPTQSPKDLAPARGR